MRVFSTAFFKPRFCSYLKGQLAASFVVPNYSHDVAFWRLADIPMCSADVRLPIRCLLLTHSGHQPSRIAALQNDNSTLFLASQIPAVIASP
jgi:hypothetical protein